MRGIRVGEQAASLFEVPAGYRFIGGSDAGPAAMRQQ
jgi:hypothetical protein